MITRRLRGLLGTTLLGCIPWATLGVLVGLVLQFGLIPGTVVSTSPAIPGGVPVALGLAGAIIGAINGLTFGALLLATERGKGLENVRAWRFASVGALATAATIGFVFKSPTAAAAGGILGAAGGAGALWLARRQRGIAASSLDTAAHSPQSDLE